MPDYIVEVPVRSIQSFLVKDCRSKAEAIRLARDGDFTYEGGKVEGLERVFQCHHWSQAKATEDTA